MIDPKPGKYWLNIRKENQLPHRMANFFQDEKFNSNNVKSKLSDLCPPVPNGTLGQVVAPIPSLRKEAMGA